MGRGLHKMGHFLFGHAWYAVAVWVLLLGLLGWAAAVHMKPTSSAISIPGTESQKTIDRMGELFPNAGKGSGRVVFEAPAGKTLDAYRSVIDDTAAQLKKTAGVSTAVTPFENPTALSKDKTIGFVQLQLKNETGAISEETLTNVASIVNSARKDGLVVEQGGDIIRKTPGEILGIGEIGGVIFALVVLVATLGSLVMAGMPLVTALVGVGISMAGLFSLSQVMTINTTTPVLAVMLGLAVGIDYSLFIISRYRSFAFEGYPLRDAAARALGTAGNAVVFAAATVVIALASLSIVQIPFMTSMGLTAAGAIAVAALVAVTLIPALLGVVGMRAFGKKARARIQAALQKGVHAAQPLSHTTIWYRWGRAVTRHPWVSLLSGVVVVAVLAVPVMHLKLGLPTDEFAAKSSTERKAYDMLTRGFGAGFNGPLLVIVDGLPPASVETRKAAQQAVLEQASAKMQFEAQAQKQAIEQRAAEATTPEAQAQLQQEIVAQGVKAQAEQQKMSAQIGDAITLRTHMTQLAQVSADIAKIDTVKQALPVMTTEDGKIGIVQVTPTTAPSDQKTIDLIKKLRSGEYHGMKLSVTGSTVLQYDINAKLAATLPEYLAVVVGLSLILLVVAFRSILVPIKATAGFLLSVLAMFGVIVLFFQWGWLDIAAAPGPIVSFVPIIAIGILFGLAMDYEFFLVSSMHESYLRTHDAKRAVTDGFATGSKVVTAAGVIMVAVFAGFIGNHDTTVQTIGFGLAVGIFIDAFIVRMTIVPAVMTILGSKAWWVPRWLDRRLPHLSIEGEE